MYSYRLTRRGRIVLTMFVILLSLISTLCIKKIAVASDSSENTALENTTELNEINIEELAISRNDGLYSTGLIELTKPDLAVAELNGDNHNEDFLSIFAEEARTYDKSKIAFLTFDDGPSENVTPLILNILDDYNIKATFFVIGKLCENNGSVLKDIEGRGHAIGIHSYSHNFRELFKNQDSFINEIRMAEHVLKQNLGEKFHTRLFRFPGGSFEDYKMQYMDALNDEGYVSLDWNAITGDAESLHPTPEKLLERLKATSTNKNNLVILMHDSATKDATAEALPEVIEYLKSEGYEFAILK